VVPNSNRRPAAISAAVREGRIGDQRAKPAGFCRPNAFGRGRRRRVIAHAVVLGQQLGQQFRAGQAVGGQPARGFSSLLGNAPVQTRAARRALAHRLDFIQREGHDFASGKGG
jgi:hypothetical protein